MSFHRWLLGVVLIASSGCAADASTMPATRGTPGPRRSGFSSPPTVNGSRKPCLDAPFTPGVGATAFADGSPVRSTNEGRTWLFEIPGHGELTADESVALMMRVRARGGAFAFLNYGLYCEGRACLSLRVNLCESRVDELASGLKALLINERGPSTARLDVAIQLSGELGPRACGAACDPIPYNGTPYYDPDSSRRGGALPNYSGGACNRDADCMVKGCGNHCVSWDQGGANEAATCEGYSMPATFCGCVERECGWFTQ